MFTDVLEEGELDELEEIVHDTVRVTDVAFEGAHEGRDEYRAHVEMLRSAFDGLDSSYTVLGESTESITVEYRVEGVHTGTFMGVEATGNDVTITGIDVVTIEDGRIKKIRTSFDLLGLLTDIGAVAPPWS